MCAVLTTLPDSCLALTDSVPALVECLWCTLSGTLSLVDVDMFLRQGVLHRIRKAILSLEPEPSLGMSVGICFYQVTFQHQLFHILNKLV